ncbi:SAM-dependent methyltransferase, partial [Mangrovactinospora gilvigrisea]
MPALPKPVIDALARLNAAYPWDHNSRYHGWILRQLPARTGTALDVGSGTGDLARLLATRADRVTGMDVDADVVARAAAHTPDAARVAFTVGSAPDGLPAGPFDALTCVAAVHHLPFDEALAAFRDRLAPGGTLAVVGLYRSAGPLDTLIDLTAVAANPLVGLVR